MSEQSSTISQGTSGTITDAEFDAVARTYGNHEKGAKFRRCFDAIVSYGIDDLESLICDVDGLKARLESMAEHGRGYTPPSDRGFGSDNAAVVAEKLLGRATSAGDTRKALADWGKNGVR